MKSEMPLLPIIPSLTFETWDIDFIGPFPKQGKRIGARYIIIGVEYVTKWVEAKPVHSCKKEVAAKFIYQCFPLYTYQWKLVQIRLRWHPSSMCPRT